VLKTSCLFSGLCQDLSGPVFIQEPPNNVDFSNSTGKKNLTLCESDILSVWCTRFDKNSDKLHGVQETHKTALIKKSEEIYLLYREFLHLSSECTELTGGCRALTLEKHWSENMYCMIQKANQGPFVKN
jgi:hypothetical protein